MLPIRAQPGLQAPILDYALQPFPFPLTANPADAGGTPAADPPTVSLVLVMTNNSDQEVSIDSIILNIPWGQSSAALYDNGNPQAVPSDPADYTIPTPVTDTSAGIIIVTMTPSVSLVPLAVGASLYIQVTGLVTNDQAGLVGIQIEENLAGVSGTGTATLPVPVMPLGFYFDNLVANTFVSPDSAGVPVAQVEYGSQVMLTWDTSVVDITTTTFVVYYSTPAGEQSSPADTPNQWLSKPLLVDTTFTVVATVSQPVDTVMTLTTSVAVAMGGMPLMVPVTELSPQLGAIVPVQLPGGQGTALLVSTQNVFVGGTVDPLPLFGVVGTPPSNNQGQGSHIMFGNSAATVDQPAATLTFAGWGVVHGGMFWTPSTNNSGALNVTVGGSDWPPSNPIFFRIIAGRRTLRDQRGSVALPRIPNLPSSGAADLQVEATTGLVSIATSSARFKENVEPLREDFERVLALEPKQFTRTEGGERGIGYLAEDLADLGLEDLIRRDDEGLPLLVDYKLLSVYLLELIKRQQGELAALREEVRALGSAS